MDEEKGATREEEGLVKRRTLLWPYKYHRQPRQYGVTGEAGMLGRERRW